MRTLIADGDSGSRFFLESVLRLRGHKVSAVAAAGAALHACDRQPFDLVVLDWQLPGMNGVELCRQIRELPWGESAHIVIVSASDQTADLRLALASGAEDLLPKQLDGELLLARLERRSPWTIGRKAAGNRAGADHAGDGAGRVVQEFRPR